MDKRKEFNRIVAAIFSFVAVALLIVAAFNNTPVDLFSLKFSLGALLYPLIILEAAILCFVAMTALREGRPQETQQHQ